MTDEELARIKAAWSDDRQRTHSERCRQWHPECAVAGLVDEVERLRSQVDDLAHALDAEQDEVVRLRDGIRELADERDRSAEASLARMFSGEPFPAVATTGELRALLEEKHDG